MPCKRVQQRDGYSDKILQFSIYLGHLGFLWHCERTLNLKGELGLHYLICTLKQQAGLFSTLQLLSYKQNVTILSLLYRYFHGRQSGELHSIVSPVQTFTTRTRLTTYTVNSSSFLSCSISKQEVPLKQLPPKNCGTNSQENAFLINTI